MPDRITLHGVDLAIEGEPGQWIEIAADVSHVEITLAELARIDDSCQELCACETYKCRAVSDPHPKGFGPFHVFPAHPCAMLADPTGALDEASESSALLDDDHTTSRVAEIVRGWGTDDSG